MGPSICPPPRRAPSRRAWGRGGECFPSPSGRGASSERCDTKPSTRCIAFLVQRGPTPTVGRCGNRSRERKETRTAPDRADSGRGREGPAADEGNSATSGMPALRVGAPVDGSASVAGEGPRSGTSGADDPERQGEQGPCVRVAGIVGCRTRGPDRASPSPSRSRPGSWLRLDCIARLLRDQGLQGRRRIRMAVPLPRVHHERGSTYWCPGEVPSTCYVGTKGCEERCPISGSRQTSHLPYLPALLRHPPSRGWLRHSHDPRATWAPQRKDYHDLHACPESRWFRDT